MKLKVYGGGGSFSVKLNDSDDHVLSLSKGLTAYEACHELATWLEDITEAIVIRGPADVAPETQPEPPTQPQQAESLEHGSPGAKFGSPGVTDWLDQGQPDHLAPVPASVAPAPTEPAVVPMPAAPPVPTIAEQQARLDAMRAPAAAPEAAPEPPKDAS